MKRIIAFLLAVFCVFALVSCESTEIDDPTGSEDDSVEAYRSEIIKDNAALTGENETSGREWLLKYGTAVFSKNISEVWYVDHFLTDRLVAEKDVCFSEWIIVFADKSESNAIVTEVLSDGERYLSDIYELTGAVNLSTVDYAYSRLCLDARYAALCTGAAENECSDDVLCFNITDAIPQSVKYTLLVDESLSDHKLYYGSYNPVDLTYNVNVTAEINGARGIGSVITRNNTYPRSESLVYLMNKSYKVQYSEETGHLVTVNRKMNETVICEKIESGDDSRLIPEIFDSFDDQILVFIMRGVNDAVIGYGIYDSETQKVTKYEGGDCPIALCNGILYHTYNENGVKKLGFTDLVDPESGVTPLGDINAVDGIKDGSVKVTVSPKGDKLALAETDAEGITHVRVYSSADGSLLYEHTLIGYFCAPKYVGFMSDGSLFVLCDKYLLCDEYLFVIPAQKEQ